MAHISFCVAAEAFESGTVVHPLPDEKETVVLKKEEIEVNKVGTCRSLRKHALAICRKFLVVKMKIFYGKKFDICLIFAQNIDCGYYLHCKGFSQFISKK